MTILQRTCRVIGLESGIICFDVHVVRSPLNPVDGVESEATMAIGIFAYPEGFVDWRGSANLIEQDVGFWNFPVIIGNFCIDGGCLASESLKLD